MLPMHKESEFYGICDSVFSLLYRLNFLDGGSAKKILSIFGVLYFFPNDFIMIYTELSK